MDDVTAEEVKTLPQLGKNKQHAGSKKKVTWANDEGSGANDSTEGVGKKPKQKQLGHQETQKQMFYRPKKNISETPPVTAEKTQEKDQEKSHVQKPQGMVYQPKKDKVPGTRTPKQEDGRSDVIASGIQTTVKSPTQITPVMQKSQ